MGYVLLWLELLAAALLLTAWLIIPAVKNWQERRIRACAWLVASMTPTVALGVATFISRYATHYLEVVIRGPLETMFLAQMLGTVALWCCGLWMCGGLAAARWSKKWLAAALGAAMVLLPMTFAHLDAAVQRRLTVLRDEVGVLALSVAPARPPDRDNAALVYAQVFERLPEEWPEAYDEWTTTKDEAADPTAVAFPVDAFRGLLDENRQAINLLRAAAAKSGCYFEREYTQPSTSMLMPELQDMREAARLLDLSARRHAAEGDFVEALSEIDVIYTMAEHMSADPFAVSQLIAQVIQSKAIEALEAMLIESELSEDALSAIQTATGFSARGQLLRCLRIEQTTGLWVYCEMAESTGGAGPLEGIGVSFTRAFQPDRLVSTSSLFRVLRVSADLADFRRVTERYQQAARLPIYEAQPVLQRIEDEFEDNPPGVVAGLLCGVWRPIIQAAARSDALRASAQVGLAMHRYRAAHGQFPVSLDELVPDALPAVPRDPYDGQPIRLVTTDDGWVVYSIGPDMVDDGGRVRYGHPDVTGDLLFRYRRPGVAESAVVRDPQEASGGDG